ncbi:VOC family protein [Bacillus velezensis]|uniref:VOC family protein n=1 Tax=Bacillus amyloliquefaciens group TaxID=1938374 RepID=UPI0008F8C7A2|nr:MULTISPECIES: VOC family protein [Bacillus amyloliquefaciens group]AUJ60874.1 glyoxalase/bleomycin resistance/extradiol dioxygenase family protein [Bacillus velezensis]MBI0441545.1 glyoxalase/bleomycin resistance/extradiol dioxygenase family protein [Bacillus velezensis]NIH00568.1 glyoxalase/bleomycin resistance/extradiol dioxygenase family protein [Bacillus amyloliquefaciens]QQY05492.1 VOC family protein [Bacillus velezensis]QUI68138.1 glyoxalase/bleomycin resistance/extradiol dioxygenase 
MRIEHAAIWVKDLERMKEFYEKYFGAKANDLYHNEKKDFKSYFLTFDSGCRLELMKKGGIDEAPLQNMTGWAHLAFSAGSKERVNELTETFKNDGFQVVSGPRVTGDGYYESVIEDGEGNLIEITV